LHQLKRAARRLPVLFGVAQNTFFSTAIRMQVSRAAQAGEVSFGPADTVLLLDSYWGGSSALLAAEKARRRGAHVATVVYDLIPITHPEFCDERLARVFPGCLEKAISISHRLLCISESTRQSLFKIYPVSKTCSSGVDVIRLGSEIGVGPPAALDAPINPRSYVMVGTIEPRKRHAIVLDAFEERWRRGAADQLVLIGKIGWRIEDFERRIRQHPELGKRLLLIEGADDAVMRAHVQGARAVIIASEVEGFGLPLIEALQLGVPVIASDIPVFREVGREYPVYFRMNDWRSLNDAIDRADVGYETRRDSLASFTWPSWGEATLEILRAAANADVSGHRDVAMD
jgi:glycosyltransferase involved in cell wall biosynthesis